MEYENRLPLVRQFIFFKGAKKINGKKESFLISLGWSPWAEKQNRTKTTTGKPKSWSLSRNFSKYPTTNRHRPTSVKIVKRKNVYDFLLHKSMIHKWISEQLSLKKLKRNEMPLNQLWYIHAMDHYCTIQVNKQMLDPTVWMHHQRHFAKGR